MPKDNDIKGNGANLGFESQLWAAADALRSNMDAAEYKHVVLGLIFLKYISDAFEDHHHWLLEQAADPDSDYFIREDRNAVMLELAELHRIHEAEPKLHIIPGHDAIVLADALKSGLFIDKFK